ncbi:hypothetical protein CPT76_02140 [Paenibacillus sp. AR247]|nr:hypothetical protein CPT76_02140 [Paenibacillus sp. AR247]
MRLLRLPHCYCAADFSRRQRLRTALIILADILQKNGAIFLGDTTQKELYLTFDNGYENGFTPRILDVLKEKKVPAIFFLTGHYVKDKPELVTRMVTEGHLVGNHSWTHPDMTQISNAQLKEELDKVKQSVTGTTRQKEMAYVRPPRGIFSDRTLAASRAEGYTTVFWSVAYKDWDVNDQKGADYAYRQVMAQLHPGAVILLHSISKDAWRFFVLYGCSKWKIFV